MPRNNPRNKSQEPRMEGDTLIHRLQARETFWSLAAKYYGTPLNWNIIQQANPFADAYLSGVRPNTDIRVPHMSERLLCIVEVMDGTEENEDQVPADHFVVFSLGDCATQSGQQTYIRPPLRDENVAVVSGLYRAADDSIMPQCDILPDPTIETDYKPFTLKWIKLELPSKVHPRVNRRRKNHRQEIVLSAAKAQISIDPEALNIEDLAQISALRDHFEAFCHQLDRLEFETGVIENGAAQHLKTVIIHNLPMATSETLYYHYGFNAGFGAQNSPYIDLKAGMRLRIDSTMLQEPANATASRSVIGSGQFAYDVTQGSDGRLTLNTFASMIDPPIIDEVNIVGEMLSAQVGDTARRYYRIIYPTRIPAPDALPVSDGAQNVALVGADTLQQLATATEQFQTTGEIQPVRTGKPLAVTILRNRTWLTPEIPVYVGDQQVYVPVGTTLAQLISRYVPAAHWNIMLDDDAIGMYRLYIGTRGVPEYVPVFFDGDNVYDLPLLAQDKISMSWMDSP